MAQAAYNAENTGTAAVATTNPAPLGLSAFAGFLCLSVLAPLNSYLARRVGDSLDLQQSLLMVTS